MVTPLEDQPRLVFRNNPLKLVVAQVRFPPLYSLEQAAGVADFQAAIRETFPVAETRAQEVSVTVGPGVVGSAQTRPGPWRFLSADGRYVAAIGTDFLNLETNRYERFEAFESRFKSLLEAARSTLAIDRRLRLGLRYVDEMQHPSAVKVTDWRQFLRPELLGIAAGEMLADRVTQALQQISVEMDDGKLTIRHGYLGTDGSSTYAIDVDAYDEANEPLDIEKTMGDLMRFKRWAWSFFRQSINDVMVEYLGPEALT